MLHETDRSRGGTREISPNQQQQKKHTEHEDEPPRHEKLPSVGLGDDKQGIRLFGGSLTDNLGDTLPAGPCGATLQASTSPPQAPRSGEIDSCVKKARISRQYGKILTFYELSNGGGDLCRQPGSTLRWERIMSARNIRYRAVQAQVCRQKWVAETAFQGRGGDFNYGLSRLGIGSESRAFTVAFPERAECTNQKKKRSSAEVRSKNENGHRTR